MSDLPGARYFKPFFCTGVCFYFRHLTYFLITPLRCSRSARTLVEPLQTILSSFPNSQNRKNFLQSSEGRKDNGFRLSDKREKSLGCFSFNSHFFCFDLLTYLAKHASAQQHFLDSVQELPASIHAVH